MSQQRKQKIRHTLADSDGTVPSPSTHMYLGCVYANTRFSFLKQIVSYSQRLELCQIVCDQDDICITEQKWCEPQIACINSGNLEIQQNLRALHQILTSKNGSCCKSVTGLSSLPQLHNKVMLDIAGISVHISFYFTVKQTIAIVPKINILPDTMGCFKIDPIYIVEFNFRRNFSRRQNLACFICPF